MTTRMSNTEIAACCKRFAIAAGLVAFAVTAPLLGNGTWSSRAIATDAAAAVESALFTPANAGEASVAPHDARARIEAVWAIEQEQAASRRPAAGRTMIAMR